eukprot:2868201-Amphidinium_carterae.1
MGRRCSSIYAALVPEHIAIQRMALELVVWGNCMIESLSQQSVWISLALLLLPVQWLAMRWRG